MTDIWNKEKRSNVMSRIRSKNTAPELLVRSMLHNMGFRFRLHLNELPGKPDIVLPKYNAIIFVHGCFWHQHAACVEGKVPQTRTDYWSKKLIRNVNRDKIVRSELENSGWKTMVVWECEVEKEPAKIRKKLLRYLK